MNWLRVALFSLMIISMLVVNILIVKFLFPPQTANFLKFLLETIILELIIILVSVYIFTRESKFIRTQTCCISYGYGG